MANRATEEVKLSLIHLFKETAAKYKITIQGTMFSGLHSPRDITISQEFSTICGLRSKNSNPVLRNISMKWRNYKNIV
jgi:hypothetical protein